MSISFKRKFTGCAGIAVAAAFIATPSLAANRCGGSLAVDAPTSLAEVARRCNVNLSALYEANPGVDPRNVTSGTYLAIPDETADYGSSGAGAVRPIVATKNTDDDYYGLVTDDHGLSDDHRNDAIRDYDARVSTRVRVRDVQLASSDPVWLREATGGGARSYAADRMSYQQRSAARIHSAGVPTFAAPTNPLLRNNISAKTDAPDVISCAVLRNGEHGRLRKVRQIVSTPTNTFVEVEPISDGEFDCTLVKTGAAADMAPTPGVPAAHYGKAPRTPTISAARYRLPDFNAINPKAASEPQKISVSGNVIGEARGCLLLDAGAGGQWALASAPGADSLVGKHVTAWGVASQSGACGAAPTMIVSHAVYAEPWNGR